MAAVLDKEPEIVDESDGDDDVPEDAYDVLESALCGEYGSDGHNVNMSQSVKNDVKNAQRAAHKAANIGLCQDTRATTEQVLDPRTRLILFKLLQRNAFAKLEGCLSTGKEANVYYALSGDGLRDIEATKDVSSQTPLAVKVYKTSILVFRDRRRYVDGEHRFEKGYTSGKNPRKMVQLWAEKELRNYKRCRVRAENELEFDVVAVTASPRCRTAATPPSGSHESPRVSRESYAQAPRARRPSAAAAAAEGPRARDGVHRE